MNAEPHVPSNLSPNVASSISCPSSTGISREGEGSGSGSRLDMKGLRIYMDLSHSLDIPQLIFVYITISTCFFSSDFFKFLGTDFCLPRVMKLHHGHIGWPMSSLVDMLWISEKFPIISRS